MKRFTFPLALVVLVGLVLTTLAADAPDKTPLTHLELRQLAIGSVVVTLAPLAQRYIDKQDVANAFTETLEKEVNGVPYAVSKDDKEFLPVVGISIEVTTVGDVASLHISTELYEMARLTRKPNESVLVRTWSKTVLCNLRTVDLARVVKIGAQEHAKILCEDWRKANNKEKK